MAVIHALSKNVVQKGDKWICLSGIPQAKVLDNLLILEFGKEFEIISSSDLPVLSEIVMPEVFDTILTLALELSAQRREGRKTAGAIFVMGKHENVLKYSHPMVINPFQGYPEGERNILDPRLKETVKEFSSVDGAFIIREDGVILAAGRHLDASGDNIEIPLGLGSRHRAAAGITSLTDALAIVVSEETGAYASSTMERYSWRSRRESRTSGAPADQDFAKLNVQDSRPFEQPQRILSSSLERWRLFLKPVHRCVDAL